MHFRLQLCFWREGDRKTAVPHQTCRLSVQGENGPNRAFRSYHMRQPERVKDQIYSSRHVIHRIARLGHPKSEFYMEDMQDR